MPPASHPDPTRFTARIVAAEDALARLDERLATSRIADGWRARTHLSEAAACLWAEGDLVALSDLVLHDAAMDVRTPSPELVRAHAMLRARRRIAAAPPGWATSDAGLDALRGRADAPAARVDRAVPSDAIAEEDALAAELAVVDALIARTSDVLAQRAAPQPPQARDPLLYEADWGEPEKLDAWQAVLVTGQSQPPTFAAALAAEAFERLAPLQHMGWLGRLIVPDLLRARQKTRSHCLCLNTGLKTIALDRRRSRSPDTRLAAWLDAITAAAEQGVRDHDRWLLARRQLETRLVGRRANSSLPRLLDLVMATPIASAALIAKRLDVTPRAAQNLVRDLGLREATGRGRYRAWGIV